MSDLNFIQFVKGTQKAIMPSDYVGVYTIQRDETYGQAICMVNKYGTRDIEAGFWVVEQDIALSYQLLQELEVLPNALERNMIIAANYHLHPATTGRKEPVIAHRKLNPASGFLEFILPMARGEIQKIDAFGLGCTYIPRLFVSWFYNAIWEFDYPSLDSKMSALARSINYPMIAYEPYNPLIHLHY